MTGYYLEKKSRAEYTGVDTYVKECLDKNELKWIPQKNSFGIQSVQGMGTEVANDEDDIAEALGKISKQMTALQKDVGSLRGRMTALEKKGAS